MEIAASYNVDSVKVSSLLDRYGIGKTALHNRLNALGIEAEKRGRFSYVSAAQLEQMDQLDLRLKAGEPMPKPSNDEESDTFTGHVHRTLTERSPNTSIALSPSTDAAILTLASMLQKPVDLLANHRSLQEACDKGWALPTPVLRELIGVKPHGEEFDRLGFRFVRTARKTEWRVYGAPPESNLSESE